MKYLITTTEVYRVDTEEQVKQIIEEAKTDNHFIVTKYTSQYKERKQKALNKIFNYLRRRFLLRYKK